MSQSRGQRPGIALLQGKNNSVWLHNPLIGLLADLPAPLARVEDYLAHWSALRPDQVACIDREQKVTFAELAAYVARAARGLGVRGVGEGDCVAVLAPPSADYLVSFLATLRRGATWLGLNPKYTAHELAHLIADARPKLILARPEIAGRVYGGDFAAIEDAVRAAGARVLWLSNREGSVVSTELVNADDGRESSRPRAWDDDPLH